MASGTTTSADLLDKYTMNEAISAEFKRNPVILDSPAAVVMTNLGDVVVGQKVIVPYWGTIGDLQDVAEDQALTIRKLSQTSEESAVRRAGVAVEITSWAKLTATAGDPYEEFAKQAREATRRFIDRKLIETALTSSLSYTVPASGTLAWVELMKASAVWTDDGDSEIALLGVHSKPYIDLLTQSDSTGRPLLVDSIETGRMARIAGIPVRRSNRLPVDGSSNYTSIIARARSLAFWYEVPQFKGGSDILTDSDITALNLYYAAHLYKRVNDNDQPGVVRVISK